MALGAIGFQFTSPCAISIPDKFLKKKFLQVRCREDECVFEAIDDKLSLESFLYFLIYRRKINSFEIIDFRLWVWGFRVRPRGVLPPWLGMKVPLEWEIRNEKCEMVVRRIIIGKRRGVSILAMPEGLLIAGFPFWTFQTLPTWPWMTKISRFAWNDDTGVWCLPVS